MSRREKTLLMLAGGVAFALSFHAMLNRFLLAPSRACDRQIGALQREVHRLRVRNRRQRDLRKRLQELAGRTFGTDELAVSEKVRTTLVNLVRHSGMSTEDLSVRSAAISTRSDVGGKEISRGVRARGRLQRVIDFLYLLRGDNHLHRLEDLTLTPHLADGEVELHLRYGTLVLPDVTPDRTRDDAENVPPDMDSREHAQYALAARRDLFRPYVKKVVKPPPQKPKPKPKPKAKKEPKPQKPKTPPLSQFKIIGLPSWGEVQDICVLDIKTDTCKTYAVGDSLAGGTIVMVDYRVLPMFDDPDIPSTSRAILRIEADYWAVELGRTLSEKRKLGPDDLPPSLRDDPRTAKTGGERP